MLIKSSSDKKSNCKVKKIASHGGTWIYGDMMHMIGVCLDGSGKGFICIQRKRLFIVPRICQP